MEVEDLETPQRGKLGFGSSNLYPKGSVTAKEEEIKICFLDPDTSNNEFFCASDIGYHPPLIQEREMLSSAHVNAALTRTMNASFLDNIRVAGKEDRVWQERGRELGGIRESGKKMPNE